jgi:hypothetical protein
MRTFLSVNNPSPASPIEEDAKHLSAIFPRYVAMTKKVPEVWGKLNLAKMFAV